MHLWLKYKLCSTDNLSVYVWVRTWRHSECKLAMNTQSELYCLFLLFLAKNRCHIHKNKMLYRVTKISFNLNRNMRFPFSWNMMPHHWVIGSRSFETKYWSRNVGKWLPTDAVPYPRRMETQATPLRMPTSLQFETCVDEDTGEHTQTFWQNTLKLVKFFSTSCCCFLSCSNTQAF